jgi:hypothetical protein
MSNTRRIPFVLNMDDPVDAAIWEALQPMLTRRRASAFIRGAVAHALGIGGLLNPVTSAPALLSDGIPRAKRPTAIQTVAEQPLPSEDNADAADEAASNFLNMFG